MTAEWENIYIMYISVYVYTLPTKHEFYGADNFNFVFEPDGILFGSKTK